jgi:hypothetical protein
LRDDALEFVEEYQRVTGIPLEPIAAGEGRDFICRRRGRLCGLEFVRATLDPVQRWWEVLLGRDVQLYGLDAALLVQEAVRVRNQKRSTAGRRRPTSTILAIQLIGSDGGEMLGLLDERNLDGWAGAGFLEIWAVDCSRQGEPRRIQIVGIKPKRWRGLHHRRAYGTKPHG